MIERFEALHVYPNGGLVALLGSVECILLGIAYPPQIAHGRFEPDVRSTFLFPLLAPVYSVGLLSCLAVPRPSVPQTTVDMLQFAPAVAGNDYKVYRVLLSEYRQSLLEFALFNMT